MCRVTCCREAASQERRGAAASPGTGPNLNTIRFPPEQRNRDQPEPPRSGRSLGQEPGRPAVVLGIGVPGEGFQESQR